MQAIPIFVAGRTGPAPDQWPGLRDRRQVQPRRPPSRLQPHRPRRRQGGHPRRARGAEGGPGGSRTIIARREAGAGPSRSFSFAVAMRLDFG